MEQISINGWAVVVAALANMVIGSLWYGPVFGATWRRLMGFNDMSMKSMKLTAPQAMFGGLLTALLSSYVLAHFVGYLGIVDISGAVQMAFWIWLGLVMTVQAGSVLWEGRSVKLFVLNTANSLVTLVAMTVILTLWM
jgi:hypothetical protein